MKFAIVVFGLMASIACVQCEMLNVGMQTDIAFDGGLDDLWVAFKKTHNKRYKPEEEFSRYTLYFKCFKAVWNTRKQVVWRSSCDLYKTYNNVILRPVHNAMASKFNIMLVSDVYITL